MLALTRKRQESIIIDGNIEITILDIQGDKVKIGINAPKKITVHRKEIYNQIREANQEASTMSIKDINKINGLIKKNIEKSEQKKLR